MDLPPPNSLGVLLVDDNALLCATIQRWLSQEPGIAWVAHETDWQQAVAHVRARQPDIVLLDIDLPGSSGLDLIEPILRAAPGTRVLMLSGLVTRPQIERALDMGASGYLVKDQEARKLAGMLQRAAAGEIVLCATSLAMWSGR